MVYTETLEVCANNRQILESTLLATQARLNVLRMLRATPAGHLGGAFSCMDALAVLYSRFLNVDPTDPKNPERDRFLLSAGHKAMAQYGILAELGFFEKDVLDRYGKDGTPLGGHPDMHKIPGIEGNTGALGHGIALATGMALGLRLQGLAARTFVLTGDGELPEGSNWEGIAIAADKRLDGLTAIIDVNGLQISGPTSQVMSMEPLREKLEAFGWNTQTVDGHDHRALAEALADAIDQPGPSAIIMHTVKAKGVRALEGTVASHYWKPTPKQLADAERHLRTLQADLEEQLATEKEAE